MNADISIKDFLLHFKKISSHEYGIEKFLQHFKNVFNPSSINIIHEASLYDEVSSEHIARFLSYIKTPLEKSRNLLLKNNPDMNIWDQLSIGHYEVKNCRVLTWLLDPFADHMQGKMFLEILCNNLPSIFPSNLMEEEVIVSREEYISEGERVDIRLMSPTTEVIIEAKINASEGKSQLARYRSHGKKLFIGIYLTLEGELPVNGSSDFYPISWDDISVYLIDFSNKTINEFLKSLTYQYSNFIQKNFYRNKK